MQLCGLKDKASGTKRIITAAEILYWMSTVLKCYLRLLNAKSVSNVIKVMGYKKYVQKISL